VPFGRLLIGPVYNAGGNSAVWLAIAGGMSVGALLFVAAAIRGSAGDAPDVVPVADVAQSEA